MGIRHDINGMAGMSFGRLTVSSGSITVPLNDRYPGKPGIISGRLRNS